MCLADASVNGDLCHMSVMFCIKRTVCLAFASVSDGLCCLSGMFFSKWTVCLASASLHVMAYVACLACSLASGLCFWHLLQCVTVMAYVACLACSLAGGPQHGTAECSRATQDCNPG